jgi:hypothetical protein
MAKRAKSVKVEAGKLSVGTDISIFVSGGACYTMVSVLMLHGVVVAETEKAIQLRVENARPWKAGQPVTMWFPKSAIVVPVNEPHVAAYFAANGGRSPSSFHLASWFRFDTYGQRVLDRVDAAITAINAPSRAA